MFKKNRRHLQPYLISNVNDLPEKQRVRLAKSWSGAFYRDFYCRINEQIFDGLYADFPSRPNAPVNELVSLEFLKAGNDWTDEEMYDHYLFDLQTRNALGLEQLGEAHFEMRTVYNFRQRLSRHMQESGVNLLDQAFEQVTDEQIDAFGLKTGKQRMDSTMLGSNIRHMGRLQLLVEVLQRTHRMLSEDEKVRYGEMFAPYVQGHAGQYIYHLKSGDYASHMQQIGTVMQGLLDELRATHGQDPAYQVLERVFGEHFKVEAETVAAKEATQLSASSLQSPDDLEATYREKRGTGYQGYVANLSETCDPQNPFQLITKVQVASNVTDDSQLLTEALPNLKERTVLNTMYADGGYGGPQADIALQEQQVELVQTAIRGREPDPEKLHLFDFEIKFSPDGKPLQIACLNQQQVSLHTTHQQKSFVAAFEPAICRDCPFFDKQRCPAQPGKRDVHFRLRFTQAEAQVSERRRRSRDRKKEAGNLRSAVEATVRSVKHPFPAGKLPVRGKFRVTCMVIGSAAISNVRHIQRYLLAQNESKKQSSKTRGRRSDASKTAAPSFLDSARALLARLLRPTLAFRTIFGC
jgi:hypothetical protein